MPENITGQSQQESGNASSTPRNCTPEERELSLFFIGLETLGEKRRQRFLEYLAEVLKEAKERKGESQ